MLVAKFPGSTYATAATNAGPRNGSSARRPRVSPLSAFCAAWRTRSSPGRATTADSTGGLPGGCAITGGVSARAIGLRLHEHSAGQAKRDAHAPALDAALDGRLVQAGAHDLDAGSRHQAAALQLSEPGRVVVGDALDRHLLAGPAIVQRAVAEGPDLAGEARDGVPMRVELWPPKELEDARLHALGDDVLEPLGLVVDLIPAVTEHLDEEHLHQPVVADELKGDPPAFAGQLLAAVPVVLDQALGAELGDHLAHRRRGDAEPLGEVAGRDRTLVSMQLIQGLEVMLLRARQRAPPVEVYHKAILLRSLGMPTMICRLA